MNRVPLHIVRSNDGVRPLDPDQLQRIFGDQPYAERVSIPASMFTADELILACWLSAFVGVLVTLGAACIWAWWLA